MVLETANSGTMVFAMLLEAANSGTMVFAMRLEPANSGTMVFAMVLEPATEAPCDGFGNSEFGDHGICDAFGTSEFGDHGICDAFGNSEFGDHGICDAFGTSEFGDHGICVGFGTSHGSSLRWFWKQRTRGPWFFAMLLEAANSGTMVFAMRLEPANSGTMVFAMVLETANSGTMVFAMRCFQTPRASAAYYVCTRKSRLSSHGSSACLRRTTFVLQNRLSSHGSSGCPRRTARLYYKKSIFQPRKLRVSAYYKKSTFQPRKLRVSPAYYVCTTKVDIPATEVHGVLRLYYTSRQKKRRNTTVFAPRPRENPQRGYVCMSRNAKTRWFWHRANAETRRGLSAATKKSTKHDGFSAATRRLPAEGCPRTQRNVKKRRF